MVLNIVINVNSSEVPLYYIIYTIISNPIQVGRPCIDHCILSWAIRDFFDQLVTNSAILKIGVVSGIDPLYVLEAMCV